MDIVEDFTTVNFTKGGMKKVLGICLHSMWGTHSGSIAWFKNKDAQASAHYLISKDGEIRQMVKLVDMAWHAGVYDKLPSFLQQQKNLDTTFNPNKYLVGIELEDERNANWTYPTKQRQALIELVEKLRKDFGLDRDRVILHKDINPTRRSDPVGNFSFDWLFNVGQPFPQIPSDDLGRAITVFKTYRFNRPQGPEGNWEGYANALVGSDGDILNLKRDLAAKEEEIKKLKNTPVTPVVEANIAQFPTTVILGELIKRLKTPITELIEGVK